MSPRSEACWPKSLARPKIPVSKLHSPVEFVGVARPKTGPWPSARAKGEKQRQQNSKNQCFMISSRRRVRTRTHTRVNSREPARENQILRTEERSSGGGEAETNGE